MGPGIAWRTALPGKISVITHLCRAHSLAYVLPAKVFLGFRPKATARDVSANPEPETGNEAASFPRNPVVCGVGHMLEISLG